MVSRARAQDSGDPQVSIIVPCLNEEESIPHLVSRLAALIEAGRGWEVVLVDDGSSDGTAEVVRQLAESYAWLKLVRHPRNLGLGAAIRTGIQYSSGDRICTMDCDCTFAPELIPELLSELEKGYDVVTGSPWHPSSEKGTVNPFRSILSRSCSLLYRMILRTELTSYTAIFRVYRREVAQRITAGSDGFVAVAETLVLALRSGYKVKELPVRLDRRIYGESKIGVVASIGGHLSLLARLGLTAMQAQPR